MLGGIGIVGSDGKDEGHRERGRSRGEVEEKESSGSDMACRGGGAGVLIIPAGTRRAVYKHGYASLFILFLYRVE